MKNGMKLSDLLPMDPTDFSSFSKMFAGEFAANFLYKMKFLLTLTTFNH